MVLVHKTWGNMAIFVCIRCAHIYDALVHAPRCVDPYLCVTQMAVTSLLALVMLRTACSTPNWSSLSRKVVSSSRSSSFGSSASAPESASGFVERRS